MKFTRIILKVLLPVEIKNAKKPSEFKALLYNEDRSVFLLTPVTDALKKQVSNRKKSFWYVNVTDKDFDLVEEAPYQKW